MLSRINTRVTFVSLESWAHQDTRLGRLTGAHASALPNHSRIAQLKVSWSTKVGSAHAAGVVARLNSRGY